MIFTGERKTFSNIDKVLLFSFIAVVLIGLVMLYSASKEYDSSVLMFRQIFWIIFGSFLLLAILRIDYHKFISLAYLLYALNLILLVLVLFVGKAKGGSHRWLDLGAFNIQPSELAKITLALALTAYLGRRKSDIGKLNVFLGSLLFLIPFFLLILIEPDLGGAIILVPITFAILYIAGARILHLGGVFFLGLASLPFFWHFLRDYQKERLFVFINPNIDPLGSGYTIIQSKIAIGSGGLLGKGWLGGTQNQLNFLPERHTDFIFSVIGEEWGFLGAILLILLYALIVYRGAKLMQTTSDIYGRLITTGFVALFATQVIVNIGMTIGFLPIVGLPLPLISYGGSSLIATLIYMGLLLNISTKRSLF